MNIKSYFIILLFFAALILSGTFFNINDYFISDDFDMVYVVSHTHTNPLHYFVSNRYGQRGEGDVYRPLFLASTWLDYQLYGLRPWGHHLTNLLLHLGCVWFIFLVVQQLLKRQNSSMAALPVAVLTASLFAVSPMHSESVVWVSGRGDLLALFFVLVSWYSLMRFEKLKAKKIYLVSIFLYALSLLSKEMAVVFPALVALYLLLYSHGHWQPASPARRAKLKRAIALTLPYAIILALFLYIRYLILGSLSGGYANLIFFNSWDQTIRTLILNTSYFLFFWLGDYREPVALALRNHPVVYFSGLASLIVLAGLALRRYWKAYLIALTITLIFLLPIINMPVGIFSHGGQRLIYFSSLGFYIIVALVLYILFGSRTKIFYSISILLIAASFSYFVYLNLIWQQAAAITERLVNDFVRMVNVAPSTAKPRVVLLDLPDSIEGFYLLRNGFSEALKLHYPQYSFDILIFPFWLKLNKENYNQDLIHWEQTHQDFLVGHKLADSFNLLAGPENFDSPEIATKILEYDREFSTGEKIWVWVKGASEEAVKENDGEDIHWLYFNKGGWQRLPSQQQECSVKEKINLTNIALPSEIAKIDRIKYFSPNEQLLIVAEESDGNRALWGYDKERKFSRLIKIDHKYYDGFVHLDAKDNIYFETHTPHFLYRSEDGGQEWERVTSPKEVFWSMTDRGDGTLYGAAWSFNSPHIYKSQDQGRTWEIWKDFHQIFPDEAVQYDANDERFKIRHLHDIVYYNQNLLVGIGDVTRWTLLSKDEGETWEEIWHEGFTAHLLIPKEDKILLGSDIDGDYGVALYDFTTGETQQMWSPLPCGWSGYIYSMLKKNNKYYMAIHNENSNGLKYGIIMSADGKKWQPILELTPTKVHPNTSLYLAHGPGNAIYVSLNGELYLIELWGKDYFIIEYFFISKPYGIYSCT